MSDIQENTIDWHIEATAVINDVKQHVESIEISEKLITGKKYFPLSKVFVNRCKSFMCLIPVRCRYLYKLKDT